MGKNLFQMARQTMEMRSQMKKIQRELEQKTAEYSNAGVTIVVRGDMTVASIKIDPEVVDITRLDKLERTLVENSNKAGKLAKDMASEQMAQIAKSAGLDGLLGGMG